MFQFSLSWLADLTPSHLWSAGEDLDKRGSLESSAIVFLPYHPPFGQMLCKIGLVTLLPLSLGKKKNFIFFRIIVFPCREFQEVKNCEVILFRNVWGGEKEIMCSRVSGCFSREYKLYIYLLTWDVAPLDRERKEEEKARKRRDKLLRPKIPLFIKNIFF